MQNVNLLDRRLIPAEPALRAGPAIGALAACALVVLGHGVLEGRRTQQALAAAGVAAPADPAAAEAAPGSAELARLRGRLATREALLAALKAETAQPTDPAGTLLRVVAALPETMWLTELELAGANDVRIAGGTLDPLALAEFARRLAETAALRGLGLETLRLEPDAAAASGEGAGLPRPAQLFTLASKADLGEPTR